MRQPTIIDSMKLKAIEFGTEYFKEKIENTKEDIIKYIEKTIEQKIKTELRKFIYSTISIILLTFGIVFLIYGGINALTELLNLPQYFSNIFFGILLLLISFIIYIQK